MALAVDSSAVVYTYLDALTRISSATGSSFTISTGNLLLVEISGLLNTQAGASSVTHNGVSMTRVAAATANGTHWVERWYLLNPTTGQTVVNFNAGQYGVVITCVEISGADSTSPIVGETAVTGTNTTLSASVTTSYDGALLIGSLAANKGGTPVTSDGTLLQSGELTEVYNVAFLTYGTASKAVPTAGSASLGFTWQNSVAAVVTVVEIKPAASGGTTYTQSTSNTATRASSALKTTSKAISDGATRSASTLKNTGKTLSYGSTRADSTAKTVGKSISDTTTRTSSSQAVVVFLKALANTATRASTASLSTTFAQTVSNTRTRSASVLKVVGKTLSNAASRVSATARMTLKALAEARTRASSGDQALIMPQNTTNARTRSVTSSQVFIAGSGIVAAVVAGLALAISIGLL